MELYVEQKVLTLSETLDFVFSSQINAHVFIQYPEFCLIFA